MRAAAQERAALVRQLRPSPSVLPACDERRRATVLLRSTRIRPPSTSSTIDRRAICAQLRLACRVETPHDAARRAGDERAVRREHDRGRRCADANAPRSGRNVAGDDRSSGALEADVREPVAREDDVRSPAGRTRGSRARRSPSATTRARTPTTGVSPDERRRARRRRRRPRSRARPCGSRCAGLNVDDGGGGARRSTPTTLAQ